MGGGGLFGVVGGLVGWRLTPLDVTPLWQVALPAIGGGVGIVLGVGFVYGIVFAWNLLRAPYRQRNEARQECRELKQSIKDIQMRQINNNLSLVYDQFFSVCKERFSDKSEIHRIGVSNSSSRTMYGIEVTLSDPVNLLPEPSALPLRPTQGANDLFDVNPSSEWRLDRCVDFIKWQPSDKTIQFCYRDNPYPEKNNVYKLVRGRIYGISLGITAKDALIDTEWEAQIFINERGLNLKLSKIEVLEYE